MNRFESITNPLRWFMALLLVAFVAGCGGGDGIPSVTTATLTSIAVTPATPSIAINGTQQFTATATYSDGSSSIVTTSSSWTSATTSVATVISTTGIATGVASGTSVITASFGGKTATATLTVTTATLTSIAVTPATPSMPISGIQQFTATATYSDGSSSIVTTSSSWTSGTPGKATVSSTGLATGVASGTSVITASFGGKTATATLTVTTATLTSIAVTPATPSMPISGIQQFTATATYSDGSSSIVTTSSSWTSGTPGKATVSSTGLATGVASGTSVITASFGGKTATATLTVTAATLTSIAVTPATASIPVGLTQQFTATGTYSDGLITVVAASWTSGSTSVATVLPTGVATGIASGTSVITASFGGKTATATLTVTSATLTSIAVTPATPSIAINGTQQFTATGTYSDGTRPDVTSSSRWTSASTSVATVLSTGVATGIASGTSVITASFGGKTATATLTMANTAKAITAYSLAGVTGTINERAKTIAVTLPTGTSVTALSATFATTGASVKVGTVTQTSGITTNDFTTSKAYLVTAADNTSTATYTVTVTVAPSSAKAITAYSLNGFTGTINETAKTIAVTVPFGTNPNGLIATFTTSVGASVKVGAMVQASGITPNDFTLPVAYIVTAADNTSTATYTVTVTVTAAASTAKAITAYSLAGITGTINETAKTIAVTVPNGTPVTALVATFATTGAGVKVGATIQASGTTANDFTSPVAYIVTAGDASTVTYTVTVTVAPAAGPLPVNLGTAGNFVILTKTGVSTTGTTAVTGDIGVSPAAATYLTGFALTADSTNVFSTSPLVTGKLYAANYAVPTPANLTTAVSDMETAFTDAAGRTVPAAVTELGAGDISGMTLVPGLYKWSSGLGITGGVTLSGGVNDVWIFQIAQNLTVSNSAIITLSGGAQAKNIFWQVSGQATLGTGADFKGIILSQTLISLNTGAVMTGRALAQTAVTLNANAVTQPAP